MFSVGDVLCLKTTGEKVQVLVTPLVEGSNGTYRVRRAVVQENGGLNHMTGEFYHFELESIDDHAQRQIAEQKVKILANEKIDEWVEDRHKQEAELPLATKPN